MNCYETKTTPCFFCGKQIEILADIPENEYVLLCSFCREKANEGFKDIDLVLNRPLPQYKDLKNVFSGELIWIMSLVQYYHYSVNLVYGRMCQTFDLGKYEQKFRLFHDCRGTLENLSSNILKQINWLDMTFEKMPEEDRHIFLENLKYVHDLLGKSFKRLKEMNDINTEFFCNNIVYDLKEDKPLNDFLENFIKFRKQEAERLPIDDYFYGREFKPEEDCPF